MPKQILEQVLEHILNKEESQAQDLLHTFFVEKGRNIYESLITSDELAEEEVLETEELVDDAQEDFADDISTAKEEIENEEMFSEEDEDLEDEDNLEMGDDGAEDDMDMEMDMGDEGADEDKIDDAILDVEDALDELKSLFAQLKGDEAGEEAGEEVGGEDFGGEEEVGEAVDFDELDESAQLLAAPKPDLADTAGNKKSPIANISKKDMKAGPVALGGGSGETGRATPSSKDVGVSAGNEPGQKTAPKLQSVKAPAKGEGAGNTRSPIAGR